MNYHSLALYFAMKSVRKKVKPRRIKIPQNWNWAEFLKVSQKEGMSLYLAANQPQLKKLGCPEPFLVTLLAEQEITRRRHSAFLQEYAEIEKAARSAKLNVFPMKGMFYKKRGLKFADFRVMSDIDLWVKAESVDALVEALKSTGFHRIKQPSRHRFHDELILKWIACSENHMGRESLLRGKSTLDIHWRPLYMIDGSTVALIPPKTWTKKSTDIFALAHALVHATNDAGNPGEGVRLFRLWEVHQLAEKFGASLSDLETSWDSEDRLRVRQLLLDFWEAASALGKEDLAPFHALTKRSYQVIPLAKNHRHLYHKIERPLDKLRLFAGYFLPSRRS